MGPSGLMVRASDKYSEGLGFKSQLDPGFLFFVDFISHSLSKNIIIHERLLSFTVNDIKPSKSVFQGRGRGRKGGKEVLSIVKQDKFLRYLCILCLLSIKVIEKKTSHFRKTGEFVANYLDALRHLAEHCNYGDILEKIFQDRLGWGTRTRAYRKIYSRKMTHLLSHED